MEATPDVAELIDAAIEAIRTELLPALDGRAAFQARVIVNVLDIARRELRQSPAADAGELARLSRLLAVRADTTDTTDTTDGTDRPTSLPALRRTLCESIREGRIDATTPGMADHLWADVLARVAIDQPTYPSFVHEATTRTRD